MPSTETNAVEADPASSNPSDLLTQLVTGPSIREVATRILQYDLKQLYPQLGIDPGMAIVVTPSWKTLDGKVQPGPLEYESLTDTLIRHMASGTSVTYLDGEHFLSLNPDAITPLHLPVKIDAIGRLINQLSPLLLVAYQEQQLEYWDQPTHGTTLRWQALSQSLRQVWNVKKVEGSDTRQPTIARNVFNEEVEGWDVHQLAIARQVFDYPDATLRAPHDTYKTRVCLIDFDQFDGTVSNHLNRTDLTVVIGTVGTRTIILTHSIATSFLAYESLEELGEALPKYVEKLPPGVTLQWRLFEPSGDFFDHQAIALIALQADTIANLANAKRPDKPTIAYTRVEEEATGTTQAQKVLYLEQVQRLIPQWLENASPFDLSCYSRHLFDLALLQIHNGGKSFDDDIAPIKTFALDALRAHMLKSHSDVAQMTLENVEIVIVSQVVWGTFTAPGMNETTRLGLAELALENLIALPLGNQSVQYKDGTAVPEWMTPDYLKSAISAVDIGAAYPAWVKGKLLDDPQESLRRQNLYASNLRIQLALQALQSKIRGEHGLDERGYRYVVAVMNTLKADRWVDGQEIVIRPLAFIPSQRDNKTPDKVTNMYVIGARDMDKGPCILYRPLLEQPLAQYPTAANLLYAIKHSKALRESTLAWLPDNVRFNYSQYVFPGKLPSVWTVSQLLSDPLISLQMSGPVLLGQHVIEHDRLATLFKANANAMIMKGERDSVSNAENRWASFKQHAWMIFSAALPFLGRTAGTAAWIWQILDDLQEAIDARENQDAKAQWSALTDLFLTLGMVLAHHAVERRQPARDRIPITKTETETETPIVIDKPAHTTTSVQLPDVTTDYLPNEHQTSLHPTTVLNNSSRGLGPTLDRYKVPKPQGLGAASTEGLHKHLYEYQSKWYAPVGERWFEVFVNDDEIVQIINTRQTPWVTGPLLINNAKGEWFVDVRLRLRGGGKKSRLAALQRANATKIANSKTHLAIFDAQMESKRKAITDAYNAMKNAPAEAIDVARQTFLEKLDARNDEYDVMIEHTKSLNLVEEVPNYREAMIEVLGTQLFFNQTWIDEKYPEFTDALRLTMDHLDTEESSGPRPSSGTFETMSDLTQGIIQKVEFAQSRFQELTRLGKNAEQLTLEYQKKLPKFDISDLKSLQVTLARELCLKPGETPELSDAKASIEQIVEDADLAVNGAMELMHDEQILNIGERIEALNNLVDQFAAIEQRLQSFAGTYPEQIVKAQLERLQGRVGEFNQQTVVHLADLLREQRRLEPRPGPSHASLASKKRVIKTQFKGTVIGQIRKTAPGHPVLVDVTAPVTGKVIATFHEKTPGVWVERKRLTKKPQTPKERLPDPGARITAGKALLDTLPSFTRRAEADSKQSRQIPVEIEEAFHHQASRLEAATKAINAALLQSNVTQNHVSDARQVLAQLAKQTTRLYAEGHRLRLEMTKRQPPTAARIEWLHSKGAIDIVRVGDRRRLKGPRHDYLQEYEVREATTARVLWYAHFHYAQLKDGVHSFTAAHLKTREQRLLGRIDLGSSTGNQEAIEIYRSEISPQLARSLFFSKAPAST
ncbi:dermonecrotic toxin domain-containing protein [Pseudomonas sp. F01002]|uniref:dermonecrotic toxin domain-containing protein n=1 Tax=Pseudomonas sp. F01002 TaxID=2555724 RepID=UPI00106A1ACF|nr:DUF6543 domain-containing protein [Pseudomonas sp. F01002]TFB40252.1 hypothetical protein E3W21_16525 [Pseudomonas sp. F01002]